jgi:hypothetical protein
LFFKYRQLINEYFSYLNIQYLNAEIYRTYEKDSPCITPPE